MLSAVSVGLILHWLRQPPLIEYILAELALGPTGVGLFDYSDEISSLAEFDISCCCSLSEWSYRSKPFPCVVIGVNCCKPVSIIAREWRAALSRVALPNP